MELQQIIAIVGIASIVGVILFKTVQSIINIKN
jgi:hypothetical protein